MFTSEAAAGPSATMTKVDPTKSVTTKLRRMNYK